MTLENLGIHVDEEYIYLDDVDKFIYRIPESFNHLIFQGLLLEGRRGLIRHPRLGKRRCVQKKTNLTRIILGINRGKL